jgi:hypothetical protein
VLILFLIFSEITFLFLSLKKASASSIKISMPLLLLFAKSNILLIYTTPYFPHYPTSPPLKIAYSIPHILANYLANKVFPVPGGP